LKSQETENLVPFCLDIFLYLNILFLNFTERGDDRKEGGDEDEEREEMNSIIE